jgi:site-specific DNA-adenine methylase
MMNLFKHETQEVMVKLIATQSDLINLYKESNKDQEEIINNLRRLVNLQEEQISDRKLKLRQLRENQ